MYGRKAKQKRKGQEICIVVRDRTIKVIIFKQKRNIVKKKKRFKM